MDERPTEPERLTTEDLEAESAIPLPTKEVLSLLDLNADVDLAVDLAAPVDLAVAANLNVAAPISAAASANILSVGSDATAVSDQAVLIDQSQSGEAIANAPQSSVIDQGDETTGATDGSGGTDGDTSDGSVEVGDVAAGGSLLNVDVNVDGDVDAAAPVAGAVAANANIAAPIDAAVAANIGSVDSEAVAVSQQTAVINQSLDGVTAEATADQDSEITQ